MKASVIPGAHLGLYAEREFKPGQRITTYTGDTLTRAQLTHRYPNRPGAYVLQRNKNKFVDARDKNAALGRFINDCRTCDRRAGLCRGNNSKITTRGTVIAKKRVKKGEEVYAPYSAQYWRVHGAVHSR